MKVLVTGGFGNIGSQVIHTILESKKIELVRCFDLRNSYTLSVSKRFIGRIEIVWGDVTNLSEVTKAVEEIDTVIHLVAILPPSSEKPDMEKIVQKVNVGGTENIIQAIKGMNTKLIFMSSVNIYGARDPQKDIPPLRIDMPTMATDNYSKSKIDCENLIKVGLEENRYCIFRLGVAPPFTILRDIKLTTKLAFSPPASSRLPFIHQKDVALALSNALHVPQVYGKILNISGGEKCNIFYRDLINQTFSIDGIGTFSDEYFGKKIIYNDWMDTEESQRLLDYQKHTFQDWLNDYARLHKVRAFFVRGIKPIVRHLVIKTISEPVVYNWKSE